MCVSEYQELCNVCKTQKNTWSDLDMHSSSPLLYHCIHFCSQNPSFIFHRPFHSIPFQEFTKKPDGAIVQLKKKKQSQPTFCPKISKCSTYHSTLWHVYVLYVMYVLQEVHAPGSPTRLFRGCKGYWFKGIFLMHHQIPTPGKTLYSTKSSRCFNRISSQSSISSDSSESSNPQPP